MKNIHFSNIIYRKLRYLRSLYKVFMQYYFKLNIYKIYIVNIPTHLHIPKTLTTFVTSKVTIMNTRLKQFIAAENITQAQLADNLNVVRASVSHILAGRNKPGYDFICGLMSHYPNLNIEWLMFGKGKMYKEAQVLAQPQPQSVDEVQETGLLFSDIIDDEPVVKENIELSTKIETIDNTSQQPVKQRNVSKIIILYDDGSFQEM